jgi:5'-nucleotidase/UDP-sugar diphosphatase
LNGERESGVRTQETNLGDLVADAALWQAQQVSDRQVDGAIVNGGSIRASIAAGDISMNDLKTVSPYDNSLNVVTVTGAELLETIEAATYSLPSASAGFPQVAGITYSINSSVAYEQGEQYPNSTYFAPANPGARITITDVGGKGFSLDAQYTIAAASFITDGGDTYYAMAKAYNANGVTTGVSDFDALTNYVSSELGGIISERYAEPQGRISVS